MPEDELKDLILKLRALLPTETNRNNRTKVCGIVIKVIKVPFSFIQGLIWFDVCNTGFSVEASGRDMQSHQEPAE